MDEIVNGLQQSESGRLNLEIRRMLPRQSGVTRREQTTAEHHHDLEHCQAHQNGTGFTATPQLIMLVLILHIGESTRAPAESASFPNHHKCGTHDIRLRFSGGVLTLPTGEVERGGDGPQ
jgi:hypothetical protein